MHLETNMEDLLNSIFLSASSAATITRQPLDGHSECFFTGHSHISRGMRRSFLNVEFCPGSECGHFIADNTLVYPMIFFLETLNCQGAFVQLVPFLWKMMSLNLQTE